VKEFLVYTGMRLLLFLASYSLVIGVWALVTGGEVPILGPIVLGFLLSGVASYFLLARQRQAFAARVQARAERAASRLEDIRSREDQD
jgi:hypothetical protein